MAQANDETNYPEIVPGMVGELEIRVTPEAAASAYGNEGVHVLATPRIVHLFETA